MASRLGAVEQWSVMYDTEQGQHVLALLSRNQLWDHRHHNQGDLLGFLYHKSTMGPK